MQEACRTASRCLKRAEGRYCTVTEVAEKKNLPRYLGVIVWSLQILKVTEFDEYSSVAQLTR